MPKETWHGIPRGKIAWYPIIDYERCVGCGKCFEYCSLGTFELEEKDAKKRPIVRHPNNCVVLCTGCDEICAAGAIKHQSKKETRETIRKLRKKYPLTSKV